MNDIKQIFIENKALLEGHFVLHSGLHSRVYFQSSILLENTKLAEILANEIGKKLETIFREQTRITGIEPTILSAAIGGIVIGQGVGHYFNARHIFVEKCQQPDGSYKLDLHRFKISPNESFIFIDGVMSTGSSLVDTKVAIQKRGGQIIAAGFLVDRREQEYIAFDFPIHYLLKISDVECYSEDNLPEDLKNIPAVYLGSKTSHI